MSLKCTNWLVKCNLCASGAVLALERRFVRARTRTLERVCTLTSVHAHEYPHKKPPSK